MRATLAWGFYADWRKPAYGSVGRPPRINPAITEIANSTIATKNTILAASIATPAIMPKPSSAAISAIIRKVTAQPNMRLSSPRSRHEAACWATSSVQIWFHSPGICDQADTHPSPILGDFHSRESGDTNGSKRSAAIKSVYPDHAGLT